MKTVPLRRLAEINPPTPLFDALDSGEEVAFLPLEAVWADDRADQSRTVPKSKVLNGYTRFHVGDIVSPKVTPTFQAARTMIAQHVGAGTTELHVLRTRDHVDSRWVAYALRSKHYLEEGVTAFQGVAGLQRVPAEFIQDFRIADIPLDEQRRIADFLDERVALIDRIIEARRAQAQLVRQKVERMIAESFSPLFPLGSLQTRSSIPVPEGWSIPRVGHIVRFSSGNATEEISHEASGNYPAFGANGLRGYTPGFTHEGEHVLVGRQGALCGNVTRADGRFWATEHCLVGTPLTRFHAPWLVHALRSMNLGQYSLSAAQPGISASLVQGLRIPSPPMTRQRSLAYEADSVTESTATFCGRVDRQVALFTEYKQSLITAAVTGELDATTAATRMPHNLGE